eukprot:TRINITY_DN4363_c0_g2_i1.p1 TRINITY_DN4363_c0_g2~~TRINITY_DN4363_c0_g2_i1.p1  ORF type:complete len:858 (+),score=211.29 TRINITY_DN4363_c0_g2_i1:225-2798(+)
MKLVALLCACWHLKFAAVSAQHTGLRALWGGSSELQAASEEWKLLAASADVATANFQSDAPAPSDDVMSAEHSSLKMKLKLPPDAAALERQTPRALADAAWIMQTQLSGDGVPNGLGDPVATGTAALQLVNHHLCYVITSDLDVVNCATVAGHVHQGAVGAVGEKVAILFDAGLGTAQNRFAGCVYAAQGRFAQVLAAPENFYVNIHTTCYPDGAIRGQLAVVPVTLEENLVLTGAQVTDGPGDPKGKGTGSVILRGETLCFKLDADLTDVVAGHIHTGSAGVDGPVFIDLLGGIADLTAKPLEGCVKVTPSEAKLISTNPAGYYVNVHTAQYPGGAIRSQLDATTNASNDPVAGFKQQIELTGAQVTDGPGDPTGQGTATVALRGRTLCVNFNTNLVDIVAAHIHQGTAAVDGPVVIDLLGLLPAAELAVNPIHQCITLSFTDAKMVLANPTGFYVNVHTNQYPGGAIRGQLKAVVKATEAPQNAPGVLKEDLTLTGAQVTDGPGDATGQGTAKIVLQGQKLCFVLTTNLEGIVAGHIHKGAAGVDGDVFIDLLGGLADLTKNPLKACLQLSAAEAQALLADPAGYYINVHTDQFPGGAIRSQLSGTAPPPPAGPGVLQEDLTLTGAQVTDGPGDPAGQGTAKFAIAGRRLCFTMKTNLQGIVAGHIHQGAAGVDGDVYVDLFGGIADLTANPLQACITLTYAQAKALVKTPADYYVNVHTDQFPGGAIRSQLAPGGAPKPPVVPKPEPKALNQNVVLNGVAVVGGTGDPAGTGTAALILTGRQLCYTLTTNQPDVTAGHIHMGVAGVDGPKIVDLTAGVADLTANPLKGCVTVTAGAASMLVGASASHYVNVHTC